MSEESDKNYSKSQLVVYCLIGFLAPVCTILLVNSGSPIQQYFRRTNTPELVNTAVASLDKSVPTLNDASLSVRGGSSFARVRGGAGLDPVEDELFLLSFRVKFQKLPSVGHRQNVIEKYEAADFPYSGWSFGVSQLGTSFRPEFYWRDQDGKGGWYTFADFQAKASMWYSFTVLARGNQYASLFMETEGAKPRFLGGVSLKDVKTPSSRSDLLLGAVREGEIAFLGDLSSVLIAAPDELPATPEKLSSFIAGGPAKIVKNVDPEEVKLWIDPTGVDRSPHRREIVLSGNSTWAGVQDSLAEK